MTLMKRSGGGRHHYFKSKSMRAVHLIAISALLSASAQPVRIGSSLQAPHVFQRPGEPPTGFFVDVFQRASARLGERITWVVRTDSMEAAMKSGDIDLFAGAFATPERAKINYFTTAWWPEDVYLVIRTDSGIRTALELKDRTVLHESRTPIPVPIGKVLPGARPAPLTVREERLEAVCGDNNVAGIFHQTTLLGFHESLPKACNGVPLRVIALNDLRLGFSVVSKLDNSAMANRYRDSITEMARSGELSEIARRYGISALPADYFDDVTGRPLWQVLLPWVTGLLALAGIGGIYAHGRFRKGAQAVSVELADVKGQSKSRDIFLATMGHEIRTPLNAILGFAELLQETPLAAEQESLLRDIRTSTNSLVALLTDVMEFSRLRSGQAPPPGEPISLPRLVDDVVTTMALKAEGKHLDFIVWMDPTLPEGVIVSTNALRQILNNLIVNAIKFTNEGYVRLSMEPTQDGSRLRITVSDSGIGIPKSEQSRVFEAFRQVDSTDRRRHGGIGLGLAIVKELTTALGGEISLDSNENFGTRFTVELPMVVVPGSEIWIRSLTPSDPTHVQIIGNPTGNLGILRDYLVAAKFDVEVSHDEEESRARLSSGRKVEFILAQIETMQDGGRFVEWARKTVPSLQKCLLVGTRTAYMLLPAATRSAFHGLVSVPLGPSALEALRPATGQEGPLLRKQSNFGGKVLVVDDNAINRRIVCTLLSNMGIASDTAENGYEGFEKCSNGQYDLILMDCQMPVMDGYESTRNIRSLAAGGEHVKIVGTSASTDAETANICRAAGMDSYLPKPITRASLERLLESLDSDPSVELKA